MLVMGVAVHHKPEEGMVTTVDNGLPRIILLCLPIVNLALHCTLLLLLLENIFRSCKKKSYNCLR